MEVDTAIIRNMVVVMDTALLVDTDILMEAMATEACVNTAEVTEWRLRKIWKIRKSRLQIALWWRLWLWISLLWKLWLRRRIQIVWQRIRRWIWRLRKPQIWRLWWLWRSQIWRLWRLR